MKQVSYRHILLPALSTPCGRPSWPNFPSLSWSRNLGCSSKQAFLTCCFVQLSVGHPYEVSLRCSGRPGRADAGHR